MSAPTPDGAARLRAEVDRLTAERDSMVRDLESALWPGDVAPDRPLDTRWHDALTGARLAARLSSGDAHRERYLAAALEQIAATVGVEWTGLLTEMATDCARVLDAARARAQRDETRTAPIELADLVLGDRRGELAPRAEP